MSNFGEFFNPAFLLGRTPPSFVAQSLSGKEGRRRRRKCHYYTRTPSSSSSSSFPRGVQSPPPPAKDPLPR